MNGCEPLGWEFNPVVLRDSSEHTTVEPCLQVSGVFLSACSNPPPPECSACPGIIFNNDSLKIRETPQAAEGDSVELSLLCPFATGSWTHSELLPQHCSPSPGPSPAQPAWFLTACSVPESSIPAVGLLLTDIILSVHESLAHSIATLVHSHIVPKSGITDPQIPEEEDED